MNFFALLRLAVNSLRHHKSRSALTALGIIIGVTTVIAILSLLEGLNRSIDQEFSALGANTIYVQKMEFSIGGGRPRNFDDIAFPEGTCQRTGCTRNRTFPAFSGR